MSGNLWEEVKNILPKDCLWVDIYTMTEILCILSPSNGKPISTGKFFIKDLDSDKFLGAGEKGELLIDSKHTMIEYLGEGEKSEAFVFIDGKKYLKSGDVGYIDGKGIFHFVDRIKRVEKIAGHSIFLTEIEAEINTVEGVENCIIARKKDDKNKVYLSAYLKLADKANFNSITKTIEKNILERINKYSLPKKFIVVEEIAKTQMGKNDFAYYEKLKD
jgi:fatty-acyl-CoA synthase